MTTSTPGTTEANLTQLEYLALNATVNVADGHARQELTETQKRIIDDLPTLFAKAAGEPLEELERSAQQTFLTTFGQHRYPTGPDRVLSCYASSVAMEILARSLAGTVTTVGLIHPTFDNIPDILRGMGLRLTPIEESLLAGGDLDAGVPPEVGALFITTPNNPTGTVLAEDRLRLVARLCRERDIVLCLDTSFRGFDYRAQYDHYAVLEAVGCRYVVIEDSGKLWPTLDLKVGMLVSSENVGLPVPEVYSDILLGVSPFILALVERFARDAADGGLDELHEHIAGNRRVLRETLAGIPGVSFPDEDSRVSVERVAIPRSSGSQLFERLQRQNVYVLPGRQFHWADPERGEDTIRVALARSRGTVAAAAAELRSVLLG
jgi:enduracididine biosynthesis enzyme MppP